MAVNIISNTLFSMVDSNANPYSVYFRLFIFVAMQAFFEILHQEGENVT